MISHIEDFFARGCGRCERFDTPDCSTRKWHAGLEALRRICLESGLDERVKWGHPCYMYAGRNIAIFGAFRDDYRLTFFNPALMKDTGSVLEKQGPNTQHADCIRFLSNDTPASMERTIKAYLKEAMDYAEAGVVPKKEKRELEIPPELEDAMAADHELATAFGALTPGRQRSYVINLNTAKKTETRIARIARFRQKILDGKGASER
jgi:uncharacterized protein YdeI (YjbR/CyaY-like superfamily)